MSGQRQMDVERSIIAVIGLEKVICRGDTGPWAGLRGRKREAVADR